MSDVVGVVFHEVSECGYFKHGAKTPQFGSLAHLLADLKKWSAGKNLANTQLTASGLGNSLPVYLVSIEEDAGGAHLVTMWNEVPATVDNQVASVAASDVVGSVTQHVNGIKQGTIPGFPTYFLFLPNVDAFATLRIDSLITAQAPFQKYCEAFLSMQSSFAVQLPPVSPVPPASPATVAYGYRANPRDPIETKIRPKFRTKLFTKPAITTQIIGRWQDICEVHRNAHLTFKTVDERDLWQKAVDFIAMNKTPVMPNKAHLRTTMSASLTQAEVTALVQDWGQQAQTTDWDDYGFRFTNESTINWLSKAHARGEVVLNGIRAADMTVSTSDLLKAIMGHQSYLRGLLV